jgi:hypothetical protein
LVAIHVTNGVAALSGYYWHIDREALIRYRQLWHVCHRLTKPFHTLSVSRGDGISTQGTSSVLYSEPMGR